MSPNISTVLVTGATGFVGSAVTCELLSAGHQVVGLVRSVDKARDLAAADVQLASGDMLDLDDLAAGYRAALERSPGGEEYNLVDGAPLTLRTLVDQVTDAMNSKRVGTIPPSLMGLIIGKPLVDSLITSFRISNAKARERLGWTPTYPTFTEGLPPTLAQLTRS